MFWWKETGERQRLWHKQFTRNFRASRGQQSNYLFFKICVLGWWCCNPGACTCREERNEAELIMYAGHRVSGRAGTRMSVLRHGAIAQLQCCQIQQRMYGDSKGQISQYLSALSYMDPDLPFRSLPERRPLRSLEAFSYGDPRSLPPCWGSPECKYFISV